MIDSGLPPQYSGVFSYLKKSFNQNVDAVSKGEYEQQLAHAYERYNKQIAVLTTAEIEKIVLSDEQYEHRQALKDANRRRVDDIDYDKQKTKNLGLSKDDSILNGLLGSC